MPVFAVRTLSLVGLVAALLAILVGCDQSAPESPRSRAVEGDDVYVNSIGMQFVRIPSGSFQMGSESGQEDEVPVHEVQISEPFYIGVMEVTQQQWTQVMGTNPSRFEEPFHPVEEVSWFDAQAFLDSLNAREDVELYRLPTEAEWEYAARGGAQTPFSFGASTDSLRAHAWFNANADAHTWPAGRKKPNPFGLHDVYGNVWEWVQDAYSPLFYRFSPTVDPKNDADSNARIIRGGGWPSVKKDMRAANRAWTRGETGSRAIGFRVVREIPEEAQ
jgi:formylglycine-generating enzyme required for sulfatase activity